MRVLEEQNSVSVCEWCLYRHGMLITHQWCCWVVVCLNAAESCSTGNIQLLLLLNTAAYWVSWSVVSSVCYICDLHVFSAVTLLCFWVLMCLLSSARGLNPLVLRPHCGEADVVTARPMLEGWTLWCCVLTAVKLLSCLSIQCSRAEPSGAASSLRWSWTSSSSCVRLHDWAEHQPWLAVTQGRTPVSLLWSLAVFLMWVCYSESPYCSPGI